MTSRIFLKLRQRLEEDSISLHAKFEKKQVEEFSYNGHLAWHAFNGRFIEDGNSGVSSPRSEKSQNLMCVHTHWLNNSVCWA